MASKPSLAQAGPRLLILGGGPVVTEFYLPALSRLGWTSGITVTDRSPDVLAKTARLAPWAATRALGFQEALADRALTGTHDAVVVAVPNSLHVAAVEAALQAGLPVLCEKPLALQAAECQRLGELAASLKLPLAVGMVRRLIPAQQAAAAAIRAGLIGRLVGVELKHGGPYSWVSDSGAFFRRENGGVLADLGVHYLDWIASVVGPLKPVAYEDDAQGGVEAGFKYRLMSQDGVAVNVEISYLHVREDTTVFLGERGRLVVGRNDFAACQIAGLAAGLNAELAPEQPFACENWPRDFVSCFAQQFLEFAIQVRESKPVSVSAQAAAATIRLIEHAYATRKPPVVSEQKRPSLPKGKVMVTGGTGFIGGALLERLSKLGFKDMVVPVRGFRTCANAARFSVELCRTDLLDRVQLRKSLTGVRWLFHLAYGVEDKEARRITVDSTRILMDEAVAAGVEGVVVLSTAGVFGQPDTTEPVDESSPYQPAYGNYGKTKMVMEKWLFDPQREWGRTRMVVLNPTCVFGPGGKTYTRLPVELAQEGHFAWVEQGRGIANYVYVDNLVDAMLTVVARPEAHGQRFIVTDGHCTWREFLEPLLGSLADKVPTWSLNEFATLSSRPAHSTTKDLMRALLNDRGLMEAAGRHPYLGPIKRAISQQFGGQVHGLRLATKPFTPPQPPSPQPVPWLVELFGPTQTRFSGVKLHALCPSPKLGLQEAQLRTGRWLAESGIRHAVADRDSPIACSVEGEASIKS